MNAPESAPLGLSDDLLNAAGVAVKVLFEVVEHFDPCVFLIYVEVRRLQLLTELLDLARTGINYHPVAVKGVFVLRRLVPELSQGVLSGSFLRRESFEGVAAGGHCLVYRVYSGCKLSRRRNCCRALDPDIRKLHCRGRGLVAESLCLLAVLAVAAEQLAELLQLRRKGFALLGCLRFFLSRLVLSLLYPAVGLRREFLAVAHVGGDALDGLAVVLDGVALNGYPAVDDRRLLLAVGYRRPQPLDLKGDILPLLDGGLYLLDELNELRFRLVILRRCNRELVLLLAQAVL